MPERVGLNRELHRILYVEDEADIRRVATMALQSLGGMEVIACASGEEALERAPAANADLLLLDVMMPKLDGPSTLRRLRELPQTATTPAVFMTAKTRSDEIDHFKTLGALDVIAKPFDALTLADTLRAIWQRAFLVREVAATPEQDASAARFAARMRELKQQFENEFPQRQQELQRRWAVLGAQWQFDEVEALQVAVHNLAGAGSTFGYDAITNTARALDAHLKVLLARRVAPDAATWRELTDAMLALDTELRRALALRV